MPKPPSSPATPRPAPELLARLTTLAQELAGAFRPATVIEAVARALAELLKPDRLSVILLDAESNRLAVTYDTHPVPARTDDPLLQLALRRGPLAFPKDVREEARRRGSALPDDAASPGSWLGAPLVAGRRTMGAVSLSSERSGMLGEAELTLVSAVLAQAGIALENARLVELLSSAKGEWEKTVDAISQAICIVDAHGTVRRSNRVFADLIQTAVTAIPGRPWIGLLPPAWSDPVARAIAEPSASTAEIRAGERVLLLTAIPMAEPGSAVLVFEDQTERRRLQEQLIQSEKMSAIGQLIAGVAHDLNNPLASVVGFSDFLAEAGEVPPRLAEPLQVIRQEAERAATIVKNLLSFARRQEGERRLLPIKPILESTLQLLANQLMASRIEATLRVEPGAPVRKLRVLVVDDEPHILHYMSATLESWGHTVEVASDGQYALERALAEAFDVIICDLRMPHLGGREMYHKLARQDPHRAERVIFATGDTVRGDTLRFLESLGRPYLHKPFTLAELRRVLGAAAQQLR